MSKHFDIWWHRNPKIYNDAFTILSSIQGFLNRFKINLVFFINKFVGEIDLCVVKLAVNIFVTRQIPRCVSMWTKMSETSERKIAFVSDY